MSAVAGARRPGAPLSWAGPVRQTVVVDAVLLALGAGAIVLSTIGGSSSARLLVDLGAACLLPGAAVLTRLGADDLLAAVGLAAALSFCIEGACALAMIWSGFWHPVACSLVLVAVAGAVLAVDLRRMLTASTAPRP
ncbi:MAG TPA: hypothetical protein VHY83_07435 [Solirubrobacteraceae bacterium]|jgi:hypothetical protein|nr:hypothetical protein [Solirubrobacteraceae bacterium]